MSECCSGDNAKATVAAFGVFEGLPQAIIIIIIV